MFLLGFLETKIVSSSNKTTIRWRGKKPKLTGKVDLQCKLLRTLTHVDLKLLDKSGVYIHNYTHTWNVRIFLRVHKVDQGSQPNNRKAAKALAILEALQSA